MSANKKFKSQASSSVNDLDTSTVPDIDHWPRLSNEEILSILRLLPQKTLVTVVSMINKRFRDLSRDASLWKVLTLDYGQIRYRADSCRKLVERCEKLETLKITNKSRDSRPLNIMSVVIRAMKSLRSLDVDSLDKWTDAAMTKLGQMKRLKKISCAFNTRYSRNPQGLSKLAHLDQLEVLKINLRMDGDEQTYTVMKNVFQQLKQLKIVELESANDEMVVALARNNLGLKELKVFDCPDFSDESIDALSDKCPDLEVLKIDLLDCDEFVPQKFSFPKLKHLDIAVYTRKVDTDVDETLTKLVRKLECLKQFNLRGFWIAGSGRAMITDALVQTFRNQNPELNFTRGTNEV